MVPSDLTPDLTPGVIDVTSDSPASHAGFEDYNGHGQWGGRGWMSLGAVNMLQVIHRCRSTNTCPTSIRDSKTATFTSIIEAP